MTMKYVCICNMRMSRMDFSILVLLLETLELQDLLPEEVLELTEEKLIQLYSLIYQKEFFVKEF